MKIGKVFSKLEARKQVASITFGESAATVTLAAGYTSNGLTSLEAKTAHIARLFIDAARNDGTVAAPAAPKAAKPAIVSETPAPTPTPQNDNAIRVNADWLRNLGISNLTAACGAHQQVRINARTFAAALAASLAA